MSPGRERNTLLLHRIHVRYAAEQGLIQLHWLCCRLRLLQLLFKLIFESEQGGVQCLRLCLS